MKNKVKRSWDRLTDDEKRLAKDDIILFFDRERDEKIGMIAAEEILNFVLQSVGDKLYNKGVVDAKKLIENRVEDMFFDLDDLLQ